MQNTRNTLILQAGAGVPEAWTELDNLYRPFIHGWFYRQGVAPTDIDDLSQEVMKTLFQELPSFEHSGKNGAFRSWLRAICMNRLLGYRRSLKTKGQPVGGTDFHSLIQNLPNEKDLEAKWDVEHQQALLRYLFKRIEPQFEDRTMFIFRRLMLDQRTVDEVSAELSISRSNVYLTRSRVLKRLREEALDFLGEPLE